MTQPMAKVPEGPQIDAESLPELVLWGYGYGIPGVELDLVEGDTLSLEYNPLFKLYHFRIEKLGRSKEELDVTMDRLITTLKIVRSRIANG